jgi:hypothetical protein
MTKPILLVKAPGASPEKLEEIKKSMEEKTDRAYYVIVTADERIEIQCP